MDYGILTLMPIVVVIILALLTKRTLEPLIAGTVVAYIIISGWSFPTAWMGAFFEVASNRDHQWVFMVCALFGSLGGIPWYAWLFQISWKTVPGA